MSTQARGSRPPQEIEGESADLFDYALIKDWLAYARGAIGRRKSVVLLVTAIIFGAAVGALMILPKTYHAEVHLQAQRNPVIERLGTGRQSNSDWEDPAKTATDLIMRHDNLVSLVRETELVKRWKESRAPVQRWKDALVAKLTKPLSDELKEEAMAGTLETHVTVTPSEGAVTIGVDWTNPLLAYHICVAAEQSFLESRKVVEVAVVSEAIGLLESHAADVRDVVNRSVEQIVKMREHAKPARRGAAPAQPLLSLPVHKAEPAVDPELGLLRAQLQGKQNAIDDLEEFRRRRISDLQTKLTDLKQVYSEFHPAVIDLQEQIDAQEKQEPTQLTNLRAEYKQLEDEYLRRGGVPVDSKAQDSATLVPLSAAVLRPLAGGNEEESPEIEQAKSELRYELGKYQSLLERIDDAKMERDTQRAAFSYRYSVLQPAVVPTGPIKPKKALVLLGGAVAGLLLGLVTAVLAEIRTNRIVERWQVERLLGLSVLAEIRRP